MSFTQLHIHNMAGSRLDGVASCEQYAAKAFELGHPALACTDHGKLSAFWEHQIACKKYGIKPIFGVEAYVCDQLITLNDKKKRERGKNYHVLLLAKNEVGYKNLLKLNYISMEDEDHFYYVNRITLDELFQHKEGLIATTGCMNSPINKRVIEGNVEEANRIYERFVQEFGDDFYTEVQLNEFSKNNSDGGEQEIVNNFLIRKSKETGVSTYIGGDVHYLEEGEDWVQTLSIAIRNKDTIDNIGFEIESKHLYYHDIKDYIEFNEKFGYNYEKSDIIQWANNAKRIGEKCNYEIPERNKMYLPSVSDDDDAFIINKSREGLISYFNAEVYKEIPEDYSNRLKRELEIIIRKGFSSYIMILEDICRYSDEQGFYRGVGRGSAAGSLVCFSLGITTIDPIKYNLLFERFLSESRSPDVVSNYFGE